MPHRGLYITSLLALEAAIQRLLRVLYENQTLSDQPHSGKTPPKIDRNVEVKRLYTQGWSAPDLAKYFDISTQRIYQILKDTPKRM
jgi:Helix-turn-helix domain of resolvase